MPIDKRLANIHAKLQTPHHVLAGVVKKHLGHTLLDVEKIIAGERNEVYLLITDKEKYVIRISQSEKGDFEKERQAKKITSNLGVPSATIVAIGFLGKKHSTHQYSLEKFVEGTIYNLYETDKKTLGRIFESAGEILGKIHSVQTVGFGELNNDFRAPYETFIEKITREKINNIDYHKDIALRQKLNWPFIREMIEQLEKHLYVFAHEPSVLVHGDFNHKHFVVDDTLTIKAILDFGECSSGSPIEDFGGWYFWFEDVFPVEILTRKYPNNAYLQDNFDLKLSLMAIIKILDLIDYFDEIDDPGEYNEVERRIDRITSLRWNSTPTIFAG